jgi:two-component system response regulator FixJ
LTRLFRSLPAITQSHIDQIILPGAAMPWNATSRREVFVIDNDARTREALSHCLQECGYDVISFADGAALLSYARTRTPAAVFIEVDAVDRSGFAVLKKLRSENCPAPIFVTSAHGAIPLAVDAIRNGAFDFIVKPVRISEVVERFEEAIAEHAGQASADDLLNVSLYVPGGEPLSAREREVLARLAIGETNKEIARYLGLSARTIEGYRAAIMRKVGARTAAELLRRVFSQNRYQARHP